jgi:hypothetical protein
MTLRRPDKRAVANYVAALKKYGVPPLNIWRRYSLRTRAAAIYLLRNGRNAPLQDLADTQEARRRPVEGDL